MILEAGKYSSGNSATLFVFDYYPFSAPDTRPSTIFLCKNMKNNIIGTKDITIPGKANSQLEACAENSA